MYRIIPAEEAHIDAIAPRMRAADVAEVYAASGRSPSSALRYSMERSDFAMTVDFGEGPDAMFGCGTVDILSRLGAPWLLGTDAIERNYRDFLRGSLICLAKMQAEYSELRNIVDDRNTVSKRWLEWLGFELSEPMPMGYEKRPFRTFEMKGNHV